MAAMQRQGLVRFFEQCAAELAMCAGGCAPAAVPGIGAASQKDTELARPEPSGLPAEVKNDQEH